MENQNNYVEELMRLNELNHQKSEMISKNAETISELCKLSKEQSGKTIEIQNRTILFQEETIKSQMRTNIILAIPILLRVIEEVVSFLKAY